MKVYFVYGFTEGEWHGKRFRRALKRRGHSMCRTIEQADAVIGHSGGCYDIPVLRDDQLLILINPPYWPGRTIPERAIKMVGQIIRLFKPGKHTLFHARKTLQNGIYFVLRQRHNKRIAVRTETFNLEQEVKHHRTILIRNDDDPWLTPDLQQIQHQYPHLHIERLAGVHDDCWAEPDKYIDLIENYQS